MLLLLMSAPSEVGLNLSLVCYEFLKRTMNQKFLFADLYQTEFNWQLLLIKLIIIGSERKDDIVMEGSHTFLLLLS